MSSNRLSRFFGSKLGRGKASSVRIQLRRCEDLLATECGLCVDFSFMLSAKSSMRKGLMLGVSVWQEPLEWMLKGACARLQEDQSPRFE